MPKELYGLIGVALGAAIAAFTSWRLDVRRERRAANAALMLLAIELANALDAVYRVRRTSLWPIGWSRDWTGSWQAARDRLLARPPHHDTVERIAAAAAQLDQLQNAVNALRPEDDAARTTGPKDNLFLWDMQRLLEPACESIAARPKEERPADPTDAELEQWHATAVEPAGASTSGEAPPQGPS
jgi:hypothetical protein